MIRERRMRWLGHVTMKYAFRGKRCTGKLRDSGEDLADQGRTGEKC